MLAASTLLLCLWGVFLSRQMQDFWDVVWYDYDSIFTLINVIIIYLLSRSYHIPTGGGKCREYVGRYIRLVGSNTLGIYFMHMLFLQLGERWDLVHLPFMQNYFSLALYAFIVMNLCLIIALLMKKIPIVRKLLN